MVRGLGLDVHLLERQADLAAHVFRLVERGDVKILAVVVRDGGGVAVFVQLEQVEFARRAHRDRAARAPRAAARLAQQVAAVALKGRAVRVADIAVKAHHAPLRRPPRQYGQRGRVGEQQQVGHIHIQEAAQGRGVEVDAVLERARQLGRHDGDVLLVAEDIAERQTDELHIVFFDKLYDFAFDRIHKAALLSEMDSVGFQDS